MKNIVKIFVFIAFVSFASCKQNTSESTTTTETVKEELYACPMHPEVTGKQNGTCTVCGMKLTEKVK